MKLYWGTKEADEAIQSAFAAGKAVLAESDTIWGLCTPASAAGALELDRLKKRRDKPYLVLMNSPEAVLKQVMVSDGTKRLIEQFWPGPLTVLCYARSGELRAAQSPQGVVGIRVPDHTPLRQTAERCGGLFSTSANITGGPVPTTYEEIAPSIQEAVGAVVYNDSSRKTNAMPSTIIDCTGDVPKIVREGAIAAKELAPYMD